jgi:hypothetical protein
MATCFQCVMMVVFLAATSRVAFAQDGARRAAAVVRATITDSASRPMEGTEVLLRQGRRTVVAARTNAAGSVVLTAADDSITFSATFEIVARTLGFRPTRRFVQLAPGDTVALALRLDRTAQELSTVRVTARESLRRRAYHLDAEAIDASTQRIRSALDVMVNLRPYMITSLGGKYVCGAVREVWVNGRRVPQNFTPDPMQVDRMVVGTRVRPVVLTILASIKPEHIAEMSYIDCFGGSVGRIGSENAVYIVLKPEIEYRWPDGTFHVSETDVAGRR